MNEVERIRELCNKNNTSVTKLEKALGYGNGSITKQKTKSMSCDRLKAIADYFGVTMDYLMTGHEPASGMSLSFEEMDIAKNYRKASEGSKDAVAKLLDVKRQDTDLQSEMVG